MTPTKKIKVTVTRADIRAADNDRFWGAQLPHCARCPIGKALKRLSEEATTSFVTQEVLVFNERPYGVPEKALTFMRAWDSDEKVKPISFWATRFT